MQSGNGNGMNDEVSGVAVFPPLLFAGVLALGLVATKLLPRSDQRIRFGRTLGGASVVAGLAFSATAIATLKRAGTNIDVALPSTVLVTGGIFRLSRNPIYVGATSVYLGVAMFARSFPAFTLLPVLLALLDRLVVSPEERYLERRFGDAYRNYRESVPRWF